GGLRACVLVPVALRVCLRPLAPLRKVHRLGALTRARTVMLAELATVPAGPGVLAMCFRFGFTKVLPELLDGIIALLDGFFEVLDGICEIAQSILVGCCEVLYLSFMVAQSIR